VPIRRIRAAVWLIAVSFLVLTALVSEGRAQEVITCHEICPPPTRNTPPTPNGSIFNSAQGILFDAATKFMQSGEAISSFRNAASSGNNPQGGGADGTYARYRTWFEGYGIASRTSARNDFPGDHRRTWGGIAGIGVNITPDATVGLSVDQSRAKIDVAGLPQQGTINLTQIGALASFSRGPWQLNTMIIYGNGRVHSERIDVGGTPVASYGARLWAGMAEFSYYVALPHNSRIVPKLTIDGTWTHTDGFVEAGGAMPVAGSSVSSNRARLLLGGEVGHTWLVDRTIMDFLVYARFVDNFVQNVGALQVSDPAGGFTPTTVFGVPESTLGGDAGAMLSAKLNDVARLYLVYDGRYRSNFTSHSGTFGAEFRF
jgi:uncharacterized protein with beta-barrel porin domain